MPIRHLTITIFSLLVNITSQKECYNRWSLKPTVSICMTSIYVMTIINSLDNRAINTSFCITESSIITSLVLDLKSERPVAPDPSCAVTSARVTGLPLGYWCFTIESLYCPSSDIRAADISIDRCLPVGSGESSRQYQRITALLRSSDLWHTLLFVPSNVTCDLAADNNRYTAVIVGTSIYDNIIRV